MNWFSVLCQNKLVFGINFVKNAYGQKKLNFRGKNIFEKKHYTLLFFLHHFTPKKYGYFPNIYIT
ncbi:hypothetical protein BpHYR1_051713 [Brachionus plicatilis]|uniref:Uncharacterized protein n=1 Tax=Brachionus plicatilis TaxID=10195 RepID=A0A3M7QK08_BRAPC|nr:hypothetical protein BpHYR1_051713 [Brachionus plicatilis]